MRDHRDNEAPVSADERCNAIFAAQLGVIHQTQAIAAGLSRSGIARRCARGQWRLDLPRVYVHASMPMSWHRRCFSVALWAGDESALGYETAARLLGLLDQKQTDIHVISGRSLKPPRSDVVIHRHSQLERGEIVRVGVIPVTNGSRTLLDVAGTLDEAMVEVALDEALRRGLTSLPRLRWLLRHGGGRGKAGSALLRVLIADRDQVVTESELETLFIRLVRRHHLPRPSKQHEIRVSGRVVARVDFAYPARRVAIEVDGYRWHSGKAAWQRDRARSNELVTMGWIALRFTWDDIRHRPYQVAREVAAALARRDA
jgi:very-short-patch-repair endonuclease